MINPSHTEPMWLIKNKAIGPAFDLALIDVRHRFWKKYSVSCHYGRPRETLNALNNLGIRPFFATTRLQADALLSCCFAGNEHREAIVEAIIPNFPKACVPTLCSMLKITFIRLWIERKIILPLGWTGPIHCDDIVDDMLREPNTLEQCPLLPSIRSINPSSSIEYSGAISVKDRELRASGWLRLVLASNLYSAQNLTAETAQDLKNRSFGSKSELARHYTDHFSLHVADLSGDPTLREAVNTVLRKSRAQYLDAQKANRAIALERKSTEARDRIIAKTLDYLEGEVHTLASFASHFNKIRDLRMAFNIIHDDQLPGGLALLPEKITNFCKLINSTYRAYLRAQRLQKSKAHLPSLFVMIAYCGPYLYKFFMNRDGNLDNYPTTFNDFSCALYVTADSDLVRELGIFDQEPPETLLQYLAWLTEYNNWTPETQYHRSYPIEELFNYIISQSALIPDAELVRNSFSRECYPKVQKSWGTVKKSIPRAYFSTFVNMLDSLEYLCMHLNEMADGTMNGVVAGALKIPNLSELQHSTDWAGLWGYEGMSCACIDFTALNYTPIFYHDRRPRPFKYIPRFYRIAETHINGSTSPRVIMNDVRITQLMCETGLRQQHLLWLDIDRYRKHVEHGPLRPLAPLLVSTDKAHGEWTAIVSRRTIDILDRQRSWYGRCTSEEFRKEIWYGFTKGSKFGKFRPMFRLLNNTHWSNYDPYRPLLLCLQYFMKVEMDDENAPIIVWRKQPSGDTEEPDYITDHSIEGLSTIPASALTSDYTPHGLRAGFVSEAIKFLPPSLVGLWLTGQSEALVSYYAVFDETDLSMSHQEMLCQALMKNQDKLTAGDFPQLAQAIANINKSLQTDIAKNPTQAISKYRLISMSNLKREKGTGLDKILAKELTELAFAPTHICPFNNNCPKEVYDMFAEKHCCTACPYAIRGIAHLPAISARKDKYKELMASSLSVLSEYLGRKPGARSKAELEQMELENDRFAREACLLEAIEVQLVTMYETGNENALAVKNREEILDHYQKHNLPDESRLLKRLTDVQNFPDTNTEDLNMRLSHLRHALLMREGNFSALLGIGEDRTIPLSTKVARQISTMVKSGAIDVFDLHAASGGEPEAIKRLATSANHGQQLINFVA